MSKKDSGSGRWNRLNAEKVREAQQKYRTRRKERRADLTGFERAKEDMGRICKRLSPEDTRRLIEWAAKVFLEG